jgi:hypothetical protein
VLHHFFEVPVGISKREFARRVGVSPAAVRKALKAGRIDLLPDGTIDEAATIARWAQTTDPARTRVTAGT